MSRNFNVPAGEMLTRSRAVRVIFIQDKVAFKDLDTNFSDPYADEWLASIEESEAYPTDEYREDVQMEITEKVLADMKDARTVTKTAKFFIEKAFGSSMAGQNKFGIDDYDKVANNQSELAIFLTRLHDECMKPDNNAALLAVGMTPAQIAAIETAKNKFTGDNEIQDSTILTRQDATRDRDEQYNKTYAFWQLVNRASKIIFEDDPIKLNEYKLPEGPQPDPDINLKGKVLDGSNGNAELKDVSVKIKEMNLETETNYAGNYNFVSIPAGSYTMAFELSGYATQEIPVVITASGVKVQNVTLVVL